ncbi:MAG: hypothetical protein ACUVQK_05710 [Thermogutta sp.]
MEYDDRSTWSLTWVRRHESKGSVLRHLMARIREIGRRIKRVLRDRAFFNVSVIDFLQAERFASLSEGIMYEVPALFHDGTATHAIWASSATLESTE